MVVVLWNNMPYLLVHEPSATRDGLFCGGYSTVNEQTICFFNSRLHCIAYVHCNFFCFCGNFPSRIGINVMALTYNREVRNGIHVL